MPSWKRRANGSGSYALKGLPVRDGAMNSELFASEQPRQTGAMSTVPNAIWDEGNVNEVLTALAIEAADFGFHTIGVGMLTALHGVKPFFLFKETRGAATTRYTDSESFVGRHFGFLSWTYEPFFWSDLINAPYQWGPTAEDLQGIADWLSELRLTRSTDTDGLIIPVHGPAAHCGVVMMWGAPNQQSADKTLKLQALGARAHWRIIDLVRDPGARKTDRVERFGLTSRELEVLKRISHGDINVEAAQILGITERTVLHHLAQARRKLGCKTRVESVSRAIRFGLI